MAKVFKPTKLIFQNWGKQGGKIRARQLSAERRRAIAVQGAHARWGKKAHLLPPSVRLSKLEWNNPVYLEEILSEGSLEAWRELYRQLYDQPFGPAALALKKVLASTKIYGITPLWEGLLKRVQGEVSV
ncbi:MAG: hypothetical protein HYU97_06640 [Deltaproteobacteria bacterium]|nr:hypothetical protein [Deltaproteobacteria bacterium]